MADQTRDPGEYLNSSLATVSIDIGETTTFDNHSGLHATVSDSGAGKTETLLKDLAGGKDVIASTPENGSLTLGSIVTADAAHLYRVLDAARIAGTRLAARVAVTTGGATLTWTYSGCQVITVPGPSLDASGSDALKADIAISYSDRVLS